MLIRFTCKNYKSFGGDAAILHLAPCIADDTMLKHHIYDLGDECLEALPIICIYGANSSGKSNLLDAIKCMQEFVLINQDLSYFKIDDFIHKIISDEESDELLFEIEFTHNDVLYYYGFVIDVQARKVKEEWLYYSKKWKQYIQKGVKDKAFEYDVCFCRSGGKCEFTEMPEGANEDVMDFVDKIYSDNLLISMVSAIENTIPLDFTMLRQVREWFKNNLKFENYIAYSQRLNNALYDAEDDLIFPYTFKLDVNIPKGLTKILQAIDCTISKIIIEPVMSDSLGKPLEVVVNVEHTYIDNQGRKLQCITPLYCEAMGIKRMFRLCTKMYEVLDKGGVLVIDDINVYLYPVVVNSLINTFVNKESNSKHAQLVFTSNNPWFMQNVCELRRDEIYFLDKTINGVSRLYSALDLDVEEYEEGMGTTYLKGIYNAAVSDKGFDLTGFK